MDKGQDSPDARIRIRLILRGGGNGSPRSTLFGSASSVREIAVAASIDSDEALEMFAATIATFVNDSPV
jgi:hypothetical protein